MSTYSITINGSAAEPMRGLNLAFASLELANMAPDAASLRWSRRYASELCPLAHNDVVEIWTGTRRLFRGRARLGTVTNEGVSVRIVGPWSHLEEQVYQMSLAYGTVGGPSGYVIGDVISITYPAGVSLWNGTTYVPLPSAHTINWTVDTRASYAGYPATTGKVDVNMAWTARHWLFRPGGTAGQIYTTIQDEFTRLMTYMTVTNAPDLFTTGTVALGGLLAPRARTITDTQVSDCVRQVLAMKPDAAVWWDYSGTGVAVLNARVASLETPVAMSIGSGDGQVPSGYQLRVSDDLRPTGVVIRWEKDASNATGIGVPYLADIYPGMEVLTSCNVTNGSAAVSCASTASLVVGMMISGTYVPSGATVASIGSGTAFTLSAAATGTLAGQRMIARGTGGVGSYQPGVILHTVTDELTIAPGIAKEVYTSLSPRRAQGSLSVLDRDFSTGLRPGMVISLTGDVHLDGVELWVQSVSWSPDTGLANLTVGYPPHLQLRDRIDLKGWLRVAFNGPWWSFSWIVPPP